MHILKHRLSEEYRHLPKNSLVQRRHEPVADFDTDEFEVDLKQGRGDLQSPSGNNRFQENHLNVCSAIKIGLRTIFSIT